MSMQTVERVISELAARQHGVVARSQLLDAGLSRDVVDRRVQWGRLRPLHRGVYATASHLPPYATLMAACLACGPGGVVSHRSAAGLWGLLPAPPPAADVEVILTSGTCVRAGIRVRRLRTLHPAETTRLHGIPVTSATRTLLDLAGSEAPRVLEQAAARALARGLTRPARLRRMIEVHRGERGAPSLEAVLVVRGEASRGAGTPGTPGSARPGVALTRSEAEERFLELVRAIGVPEPRVNATVEGYEVDFFWPAYGLVVEIDGFAYHSSRTAFEADRQRDADLVGAGLRVMRVTWRQLVEDRDGVLVRLVRAFTATNHS